MLASWHGLGGVCIEENGRFRGARRPVEDAIIDMRYDVVRAGPLSSPAGPPLEIEEQGCCSMSELLVHPTSSIPIGSAG